MLRQPIQRGDSEAMQKLKKEYVRLTGTLGGVRQMSDIEYMSLAAYIGSAYTEMNQDMRRQTPTVAGKDKKARGSNRARQDEVQSANLMAVSALNKLPDWDGSVVYRGENITGRENSYQANTTIALQSFTSTTIDERAASGFANGSAVWEITGITHSGKDVSKSSGSQSDLGVLSGQSSESEVLLKPYTKLRITNVVQQPSTSSFKWRIFAQQA